nr:MAG TPA: hypothetical protein [Caudoviricetes sp.]
MIFNALFNGEIFPSVINLFTSISRIFCHNIPSFSI